MTKQEKIEYKKRVVAAKDKLRTQGFDSLSDFEIIELYLMFSLTTSDATIVAHKLFEKFGSLVGILDARASDLIKIEQMNEQAVCLLHSIMPLYAVYHNSIDEKPRDLRVTQNAVDFLKPKFFDTSKERVYIICLDSQFKLIACEIVSEGEHNSVIIDQAKLISYVALSETKFVILAHNHPHGLAEPTPEDDYATTHYLSLLNEIDVILYNHIIISDTDYFSYRDSEWYDPMFE